MPGRHTEQQHPLKRRHPGGTEKDDAKGCPKSPLKPLPGSHYLNESVLPTSIKPWVPLIKKTDKASGVPSGMLAAIILKESEGKADAKNGSAQGLAQIKKNTFQDVAKRNCIQGNISDPKVNLKVSAIYFRELYEKHGNWSNALGFYKAGYKGANPQTQNPETKNYIKTVIRNFWKYSAKPQTK
jgi:soluble lytic murein transglycosylase-like protein